MLQILLVKLKTTKQVVTPHTQRIKGAGSSVQTTSKRRCWVSEKIQEDQLHIFDSGADKQSNRAWLMIMMNNMKHQ
jgi:hypothetical protein